MACFNLPPPALSVSLPLLRRLLFLDQWSGWKVCFFYLETWRLQHRSGFDSSKLCVLPAAEWVFSITRAGRQASTCSAQHVFLMALKVRGARAFALGHVVFRSEVVYRSDTKSWCHLLARFVLLLIILAQDRWLKVIKCLCGKIHRLLSWKCFI